MIRQTGDIEPTAGTPEAGRASVGEDATPKAPAFKGESARVGVVSGRDRASRAALEQYLAGQGIEQVRWFTPGELHDLDRAVRRGRIDHVVFPAVPDLLAAIWDEEIIYDEWPAGVRVDFVRPPDDKTIPLVAKSWRIWRKSHQRRQAVAGAVLSMLVLILAFCCCVLLAR